jgi:hypothetical protein
MNTLFNLAATPGKLSQSEDVQGSIFHGLLYTVFQKPRDPALGGVVIAIGSCNPGEGVTFVTRALLHELGKYQFNSVAGVNMSFLRKLHEPTLEAIRNSLQGYEHEPKTDGHSITTRRRSLFAGEGSHGPWESNWQYRRDCIDLLRAEFDYSIIDCPALKVSGDLLSIAPFVDGVIMVIAANRTRRDEPRQAEHCIATADGKLLGFILNKRTPEMPSWLDHML